MENNSAEIEGIILDNPVLSHELYGEKFYNFDLEVQRLSKNYDKINILFSERLLDINKVVKGEKVKVVGQFRSYNISNSQKGKHKLKLLLFAHEIEFIEEDIFKFINQIELKGYICKKPIYRTTPFGREITDLLLAVNRAYNKSDYIPCVVWGRNARYTGELPVGKHLKINGRIQSREYEKKFRDNEVKKMIAFEISVSRLEEIDE